jgi:hypothetical protein
MIFEFQKQHTMDYTVKTAAAVLYLYLNRWPTRGNLLMRRMPAGHLTTELTTFRRHETTWRWRCWRRRGERESKGVYQVFFWVLIDLILELLGLIIKQLDNQTESWNPVSIIWLSSHLTLSFDNQWSCYLKTFTKRFLTNQTNQTKATESAHMTTTSSAPFLLPTSCPSFLGSWKVRAEKRSGDGTETGRVFHVFFFFLSNQLTLWMNFHTLSDWILKPKKQKRGKKKTNLAHSGSEWILLFNQEVNPGWIKKSWPRNPEQNVFSQIKQTRLKPLIQSIWQPPPLHPFSYQPPAHRRLLLPCFFSPLF